MHAIVDIGGREVGPGRPAFVIAEAGSNHDRNLDQARRLIDAAADARADAVKFQLFSADVLYPDGGELHGIIKQLELPYEWVPDLVRHAKARDLLFLASAFDRGAVDLLCSLGAPALKWASSETVNLGDLAYAAARRVPMIVSTGMCDLADVVEAVEVVRASGNEDLVLLQCTTLYPTAPSQVHLAVLETLRTAFQVPVGYSDHTLDLVTAVVAVARGASVIEKHFTLDRSLPGPDHSYAAEPHELARLVEAVREAEQSIGSGHKQMLPEERIAARRTSLHARTAIPSGTRLSEDHLVAARPADGLRPRYRDAVIGRLTASALLAGEPITWEKLQS